MEPSLLRRRLPYLPYAAYDPTAGELRGSVWEALPGRVCLQSGRQCAAVGVQAASERAVAVTTGLQRLCSCQFCCRSDPALLRFQPSFTSCLRAGSSRGAGGEGSVAGFDSPERSLGLGLENGGVGAASPIGDGSETAGDRYQRPLTQRRRVGEAELTAVGVE